MISGVGTFIINFSGPTSALRHDPSSWAAHALTCTPYPEEPLYAIARREALRRLKARKREQPTDQLPDRAVAADGPEHDLARRELAELVAAACAGLPDRERAVFELHYRQGLDGPSLAEALGVSATNANTMVARMRSTIERSLGALLVARHRVSDCPDLGAILNSWDGVLTVLLRKRIARHVDQCPGCQGARRDLVNPRTLLTSAPVVVPAPAWLCDRVLEDTVPIVEAIAPPAGKTFGAVVTASWWPPGIGTSTTTVLAYLAPLAGAAVAAPLVMLGTLNPPSAQTAPQAATSEAPAPGVVPTQQRSRGGFTFDTSTTRYAPTDSSSVPDSPQRRVPDSDGPRRQEPGTVPRVNGGADQPGASAGGFAAPDARRGNGAGAPPRGRRGTLPPLETKPSDPRTKPSDPREQTPPPPAPPANTSTSSSAPDT